MSNDDDDNLGYSGGILASAGLDDFEGIQTKVEAEGVGVTLNCRLCNKKRKIILEWPELVELGENEPGRPPWLPRGWQYSPQNGTAYTQLQCPKCGGLGFAVHMMPGEAQTHVQTALKSRIIPVPMVQQIQQLVAQRRGR